MEKHPDDLLTGDSDPFKGDPNFMASLARGLEVIQAFTPQRPVLSISQISQKTGIPRAAAPLPVHAGETGIRLCGRWQKLPAAPAYSGPRPRVASLHAAGAFGAACS